MSRIRSQALLPLLFVLASQLLSACSSPSERPDPRLAEARMSPGAEQWSGAALRLPAHAPVVGVVRLEEVFAGAQGLMDWAAAEPQMFGPNGDAVVGAFLMAWQGVVQELGADPFSAVQWQQQGIDPVRELYFGFYPASQGDSRAFVEAIESTLLSRLELESEENAIDAIRAQLNDGDAEFARGVTADVLRAVSGLRPQSGARLIIPVTDDARLLANVIKMAAATNYQQVANDEVTGPSLAGGDHVFFNADSSWPAFMVRLEGGYATIDVVFKEFQARALAPSETHLYRKRMLSDLLSATTRFPAGAPAAPRPPDRPAVALAFHQLEAAWLARVRGYMRALESLRTTGARARDDQFIELAARTMESAHTWEIGARNLPGTTYSLARGCQSEAQCIFNLEMHLFGSRALPGLNVVSPHIGLDISERSMGASIDLDPFFSPAWKQWIGVTTPVELLDGMDASHIDPVLSILSIPRGMALTLVNVEAVLGEDLGIEEPSEYEHFIAPLRHIQRLEIASVDLDMRRQSWHSRLAAMFALKEEASAEERDGLVEALRMLVVDAAMELSGGSATLRNQISESMTSPLKKDVLTTFELPEQHALSDLHYFYQSTNDKPFVFLTRGLSYDEAESQLKRLQRNDRPVTTDADVLSLRLEPLGLMSLLTEWRPHTLEPLDLGIVVQRLGPMIISIRPHSAGGVATLRYMFELHAPPVL
ncbi:MAG: hypothetical protein H0U74_06595 [Bradymonadaceae bacterium]|nr:hypothetical protein [Lujinxingiaceae bacterium]